MKEVNFLRKRDAAAGKIEFVDIAEPSYRAEDNAGITFQQVSWPGWQCSCGDVYCRCGSHALLTSLVIRSNCMCGAQR
jgi:hypothetical protein